jgi:hypothetical protein
MNLASATVPGSCGRARTNQARSLAARAVHLLETHRITPRVVVEANEIVAGALEVHDPLRAGVF